MGKEGDLSAKNKMRRQQVCLETFSEDELIMWVNTSKIDTG